MRYGTFAAVLRWSFAAAVLSAPFTARGTTVAAEYCTTDACGNPTLPNASGNATGWMGVMQGFGYTRRFVYGNSAFWPDDLVSCSVPGGKACIYDDTANLVFLESHGGSDADKFRITTGVTHTIDGVSTCRAWTRNPGTLNQWWAIGANSMRILSMVSCHSLELTDLAHWDGVTPGLHMIAGGDGELYDNPGRGGNYAFYGTMPFFTVKQAWFAAHDWGHETAVVMAYGVDAGDAVNRRENERFNWGMSPLGPHTYRAWSWIH
ncbi:MAG TPA: DUF6345 domain-containing protein [Armatimonadota bacterium]|jgi:hypothetical protein